MKLNLALLLLILLSVTEVCISQKTWEFTFEDGSEKTFTLNYDDPTFLPKFSIGGGIGFTITGEGSATFQALGEYRFTDDLMANLRYTRPFSEGIDAGQSDVSLSPQTLNTTQELFLIGHYKLLSSAKSKRKSIPVDYESDGHVSKIYKAEVPRVIKHSLDIDLGYSFLGIPQPVQLVEEIDNMQHYVANNQYHQVVAGLSYAKDQAYFFTTDDSDYEYKRHARIYLNFSYAVASQSEYYQKYFGNSIGSEPIEEELTDPENIPELSKIGWRLGMQSDLYIRNSDFGLYIGAEFGARPHYEAVTTESGNEYEDSDLLLMIHFGIKFGKQLL